MTDFDGPRYPIQRPDPLLCRVGFHQWSNWEWGRWERYGPESYRKICERGCGTYQEKSILWMISQRVPINKEPKSDNTDED